MRPATQEEQRAVRAIRAGKSAVLPEANWFYTIPMPRVPEVGEVIGPEDGGMFTVVSVEDDADTGKRVGVFFETVEPS
jgi:hypothetical protein